ncbi:MAG: ATP-binding cassette domain-containing protein [Conexivisphaerales archaeon]
MLKVNVFKTRDKFTLKADLEVSGTGCILGKNGSGKTTLLSIIAGLLEPDSGTIMLNGRDITELRIEDRKVVLITPETYIPNLTVEEHLKWSRKEGTINIPSAEIKNAMGINFKGPVGNLSTGNRIRVAIATALLSDIELVLVDEAFSFIDNKEDFISKVVTYCKQTNRQLVFSTQDKSDTSFADQVYLLEEGFTKKWNDL